MRSAAQMGAQRVEPMGRLSAASKAVRWVETTAESTAASKDAPLATLDCWSAGTKAAMLVVWTVCCWVALMACCWVECWADLTASYWGDWSAEPMDVPQAGSMASWSVACWVAQKAWK